MVHCSTDRTVSTVLAVCTSQYVQYRSYGMYSMYRSYSMYSMYSMYVCTYACKPYKICQLCSQITHIVSCLPKRSLLENIALKKTPAANRFSRKQGLGLQIHIQMQVILSNID